MSHEVRLSLAGSVRRTSYRSLPVDVAQLIREADEQELIWELLVEHEDGRLECHSWNGTQMAVLARAETVRLIEEWLLVPEPVDCREAARAGIDVMNACARCGLGSAP